jgi:ParB-like chromosome segregation protein Spo0J
MRIETLPLEELIPYARNSRSHEPAQIAQIAASIKEFGFTNPVLIDGQGTIIAGHGRVLAAYRLGLEEVPCIRLGHLTDTQRRAYVIVDNKLALNAGWDEELLQGELLDLNSDQFRMELLGFSDTELTLAMYGDLHPDDAGDGLPENYSRKIQAPIYTPKGEKPEVGALYDETKATELKREIKAAELPAAVRKFLLAAADRHTVFDFRNIAEFYAHAEPMVQDLMERSALVIIDYDKAIENGFVELSAAMMQQAGSFKAETEGDDAE